jgi:hypothetical protein
VIYFETKDGRQVVVLNRDELANMKNGVLIYPAKTMKVFVGYSPDEKWMGDQLANVFNQQAHQLPLEKLQEILKEGMKRSGVIDV